jgi:hydrogenase maturation factor
VSGLFRSIHAALDEVGAHLVGGHTEVTPAVTRPIVVGQMLGIAEHGVVATSGFGPGEQVIQVKPAPIEGAAVLARHAGAQTASSELLDEARAALERPGVSVVASALLATELGATALHDPTEGGLAGGLHELASAAGQRIVVDRGAVLWFPPGIAVCEAVGADPWATLASGTLLAPFPETRVPDALAALKASGCEAAVIARGEPGSGVMDSAGKALPWPDRDEVARLLSVEESRGHGATI